MYTSTKSKHSIKNFMDHQFLSFYVIYNSKKYERSICHMTSVELLREAILYSNIFVNILLIINNL